MELTENEQSKVIVLPLTKENIDKMSGIEPFIGVVSVAALTSGTKALSSLGETEIISREHLKMMIDGKVKLVNESPYYEDKQLILNPAMMARIEAAGKLMENRLPDKMSPVRATLEGILTDFDKSMGEYREMKEKVTARELEERKLAEAVRARELAERRLVQERDEAARASELEERRLAIQEAEIALRASSCRCVTM
jgi:hypothetical protein